MPIFIDPNETRKGTTLPQLDSPDAIVIPNLSSLIGGDWLISTWRVRPKTAKLVRRHIKRAALVVECKRMTDLMSSLMGKEKHLYQQAARMAEICPNPAQRILLYTGFHAPTTNGKLRIGEFDGSKIVWKTTRYYYEHFMNAATKLRDSGLLRWEGLSSNREIPIWISSKLRHLAEYEGKPVKVVLKQPSASWSIEVKEMQDGSLRKIKVVNDARNALIALSDNLGMVRTSAIFDHCGNSLAWALQFLSNPTNAGTVKGIGKGIFEEFRQRAGLEPGYGLSVLGLGNKQCKKHSLIFWDREICPICEKEGR